MLAANDGVTASEVERALCVQRTLLTLCSLIGKSSSRNCMHSFELKYTYIFQTHLIQLL